MENFKIGLQKRLLDLSVKVIVFTRQLPDSTENRIIKYQLIKSVTSVGANYQAACRAKSRADFINKLHIVEEECDESIYWIKLISVIHEKSNNAIDLILAELIEIMSIIVASLKTMKGKM